MQFKIKEMEISTDENPHRIIESGITPFTDTEFPPEQSSIIDICTPNKLSISKISKLKSLIWRRPNDLFPSMTHDLVETITPNSIIQGHIGNCYFISALSALAEHPERIRRIFEEKSINPEGRYKLRIFINGEYTRIHVDDNLPFNPAKSEIYFSKSKKSSIWVSLIEKAWVKVNRSYVRTIRGTEKEALRFLTGAPCEYFLEREMEEEPTWRQILESADNKWTMCAATKRKEELECIYNIHNIPPNIPTKALGLVSQHAYSITQAKEVQSPKTPNTQHRILLLRNPQGSLEWKGQWSKESDIWTEELKEELGYDLQGNGTFFISLRDFVTYFSSITICYYNPKYINTSILHNDRMNYMEYPYTLYQMDILEDNTHGFFTIYQREERFQRFSGGGEDYKISFANMLIACYVEESNSYEYVDSKHSFRDHLTIQLTLHSGVYVVFVEMEWEQRDITTEYTLNAYTNNHINIKELKDNKIYSEFLPKVLTSCVKCCKKLRWRSYNSKGAPDIYKTFSFSVSNICYGLFYYKNKSSTRLREIVDMKNYEYYPIVYPVLNEGKSKLHILLNPGEESIIIFHTLHANKHKIRYSFISQVEPSNTSLLQSIYEGNCITKELISKKGKYYNTKLFTHKHKWGKVYHFRNESEGYRFSGGYKFKVKNAVLEEVPDYVANTLFQIVLEPGESRTLYFRSVDQNMKNTVILVSLPIRYTKLKKGDIIPMNKEKISDFEEFKGNNLLESLDEESKENSEEDSVSFNLQNKLLKNIYTKGKYTPYETEFGEEIGGYYEYYMDGVLYLVFINSSEMNLYLNIKFEIENLKNKRKENEWNFELMPFETCIKYFIHIDIKLAYHFNLFLQAKILE